MKAKGNGGNGTGTDLALRTAVEYGFSETQLELIRNTAAKGCTPEEIAQLLITARRSGLDPLAKQIYMIRRWDSQTKREIATPQTGIDGYRLVADRTERYAPGREPSYTYDEQGNLHSATAYVKKLAGGAWHEVASTAFWSEYVQTKKDGAPTSMWLRMPHLMLAKCAEALTLRKAFPAELSGLYTAEEMAQADSEPVEPSVVIEPAPSTTPPPPLHAGQRPMSAFQRQKIEELFGKCYPGRDVDAWFLQHKGHSINDATYDEGRAATAALLRHKRNRPRNAEEAQEEVIEAEYRLAEKAEA